MARPNILMISIDALRPDRMSMHGYQRPTTPTLEGLAESGTYCDDCTSTTAFTQPALPSMLTSSRPFSFGGYDQGAVGRPATLFKVLSEGGYRTTLLSTFPWVNRFYGYDDGVHTEDLLFVINALVGVGSQTMASFIRAHQNGEISREILIESVQPILSKLFNDLDAYCDHRLERRNYDLHDLSGERLLTDGYHYPRIKKVLAQHRTQLKQNPGAYIDQHLSEVPNAHNWIAQDWRRLRNLPALSRFVLQRLARSILQPISPSRARLTEFPNKRYVDAHALATRVIRTIDQQEAEKPFFIWTHFFDTHVPYCPGIGRNWKQNSHDHLSALGYAERIDLSVGVKKRPETDQEWEVWRALYDASIHYIDSEIARIQDALRERGLDENTLVVITSDHGEELGEHGDVSHHFRLYEHNLRIPLLFSGPGVPARKIVGLSTIMDLSPTIADIIGVDAPTDWEGRSIYSDDIPSRDYVLAEAFHSGNCLFEHRPPYVAVRTRRTKYLWKEHRDVTDTYSSEKPELYDYLADPMEQNDIYDDAHPELPALNRIVATRLAEVPEFSNQRIVSAFGDIGRTAISEKRDSEEPAAKESIH